MWNPGNYEDKDFGLARGEAFEPVENTAAPVETDRPHVMTVLGPISPEDLGICLVHAHLLASPSMLTRDDADYRLDNLHLAAGELEAFVLSGGRSIVDSATRDYGRDIDGLVSIAQRIPAHVIASTGRQSSIHAESMDHAFDTERLAEELVQEITFGTGRSSARPGMLAFASGGYEFTAVEESAARAVVRASVATGVPISAQSDSGPGAVAHLDLVEKEGGEPNRTIFCSQDRSLEIVRLEHLLKRGAWCSFDQLGRSDAREDVDVARLIVSLSEAGYADRILLSEDLPRVSMQGAYGGVPGLIHLLERFTLTLMDAGASGELVRRLLVDNPARALTIVPVGVRRS